MAKGLVKREVTRVVTPGTVTEDDLLDPRRANHLAALWPRRHAVGLAWVELSAGPISWPATCPVTRLADELGRPGPVGMPARRETGRGRLPSSPGRAARRDADAAARLDVRPDSRPRARCSVIRRYAR